MSCALIKFETMNRNLDFRYLMQRWFSEHPSREEGKKMDSKLAVPLGCQFIPMRWSYGEMIVAQAQLNQVTRRQERTKREIDRILGHHETRPEPRRRLNE